MKREKVHEMEMGHPVRVIPVWLRAKAGWMLDWKRQSFSPGLQLASFTACKGCSAMPLSVPTFYTKNSAALFLEREMTMQQQGRPLIPAVQRFGSGLSLQGPCQAVARAPVVLGLERLLSVHTSVVLRLVARRAPDTVSCMLNQIELITTWEALLGGGVYHIWWQGCRRGRRRTTPTTTRRASLALFCWQEVWWCYCQRECVAGFYT